MKAGDLVRFKHSYRDTEKGVFLVVRVQGNTWIELHNGPDLSPNGMQTLHSMMLLEVISEGR